MSRESYRRLVILSASAAGPSISAAARLSYSHSCKPVPAGAVGQMPPPIPLALPLPSALHFLQYSLSLSDAATKTLLIICTSRADFLDSLVSTGTSSTSADDLHRLTSLVTTPISILAASTHIRLIFTPTIQHLRAYLSALDLPPPSEASPSPPILAIWGLVEAHCDTTEYSAQGIGRTVALVVATGARTGMRVVVGGLQSGNDDDEDQENGNGNGNMMVGITSGMDVQVPILNSTVKLGRDMEVVARGRVYVRDIFRRWFLWKAYEEEEPGGELAEEQSSGMSGDDEL